jgi:hypothetical protein
MGVYWKRRKLAFGREWIANKHLSVVKAICIYITIFVVT